MDNERRKRRRGARRGSPQLTIFIMLEVVLAGGCNAILGLGNPTVEYEDAGAEATADTRAEASDDVNVIGPGIDGGGGVDGDAQLDADVADADADAEPEIIVTYNEQWDDSLLWNKIDLKTFNSGLSRFTGAVFDGRYIYFAPSNNSLEPTLAVRYDTNGGAFTINTNWEFFDTATLHPDSRGFEGAYFDGRNVCYVPFANSTVHTGRLTCFDTKAGRPFTDALAWSHFDTTSVNQYAKGFIGGAYDGQKYAYMAPGLGTFPPDYTGRTEAVATRVEAQAFKDAAAWQTFDTQLISPLLDGGGPRGFFGTVFTGTHLYFVPYGYAGGVSGRAVRYDVSLPFNSSASWEVFDATQIHPHALGYQGGGFDGRYVYYVPLQYNGGGNGLITRFDTKQSFTQPTSWSAFDLETLDGGVVSSQVDSSVVDKAGFVGTGFDGRFLYFVGDNVPGHQHGWIARFDTLKPMLDDPTAWSLYDTTRVDPGAVGLCGAVFDGQYLYFVPCFGSVIVRFYASYPAKMPKFMRNGSFL